jgi:hypothetical protein
MGDFCLGGKKRVWKKIREKVTFAEEKTIPNESQPPIPRLIRTQLLLQKAKKKVVFIFLGI